MYRVKFRYVIGNISHSGKLDVSGSYMGEAENKVRRKIASQHGNCTITSVQSIPDSSDCEE